MSKDTEQGGPKGVSYEVFKLEPLDKPYTSGSGMDDPTFEAFEVVDGDQRAMFQTSTFDKRHNPIAEAKKKAASIEREAYEKGFAQGEKDGLEIGTKKIDNVLDRIHQTLQEMGSYWQEFTRLNEKEILHMICLIAEKVVRGTVKVDHRVVRESIFEALNLAAERSEVTVRLSPQDVEYVKEVRPEFFDRIKELKSITIESDPSVSPGGCFMETAFGQVDARLESQLNEIAKAVERAYGERPNQPK